jgi:hypothetical protein
MTVRSTFSVLLVAFVLSCRTPSTSDTSLSSQWLKWEPIQPPRSLAEHDWLNGDWQCTRREHQEFGVERDYDAFVYMGVVNMHQPWLDERLRDPWAWVFTTAFLRPDKQGRLGETTWPGPLGYFNGMFTLGHPAQCDGFYMRRNPRNATNEFILKHAMFDDFLLLKRVSPSPFEE